VSPVRYDLGFYIPEDGILHNHRSENKGKMCFSERFVIVTAVVLNVATCLLLGYGAI
jgi:hypothetical protein